MKRKAYTLATSILLVLVMSHLIWGWLNRPLASIKVSTHSIYGFDIAANISQDMIVEYWVDYYQNGHCIGTQLEGQIELAPRKYGLASRHKLLIVRQTMIADQYRWLFMFDGTLSEGKGAIIVPKADHGAGLYSEKPITIISNHPQQIAVYGYGPIRSDVKGSTFGSILEHMTHVLVLNMKIKNTN